MREQLKIVRFAMIVCLVCSVLLAFVSSFLSERQDLNRTNDIRTKVLQVFGVPVFDAKGKLQISQKELDEIFATRITGIVLNGEGEVVTDRKVNELPSDEISEANKETGLKPYYPLYIYQDPDSGKKLYGIHVAGKGLWSTIKGYMALEEDLSTIAGLVFYAHAETPGLGAEVEKAYFQDQFEGKKWMANQKVQHFDVKKPGGKLNDHSVDGITAATMTSIGVEHFLNQDFAVYNTYFEKEGLRN
ncbi:MAG: NADH:ubiquinone reductase (Na(+)-transporting) subunit C [Lentisphaerae bacterium]|nr:NADH:ubiquinone reductase (Na(+)-transporting) subunit C [Lentisphaerota bacterium]